MNTAAMSDPLIHRRWPGSLMLASLLPAGLVSTRRRWSTGRRLLPMLAFAAVVSGCAVYPETSVEYGQVVGSYPSTVLYGAEAQPYSYPYYADNPYVYGGAPVVVSPAPVIINRPVYPWYAAPGPYFRFDSYRRPSVRDHRRHWHGHDGRFRDRGIRRSDRPRFDRPRVDGIRQSNIQRPR